MTFVVGLFGGGKSQAQQQAAAAGMNVQTSVQGKPIPLVYGTSRIAPNLIWYGDFLATPQSQTAGKGGVGGGGGGKGGSPGSYTYSSSFEAALCEGQINGINYCYLNKNITSLSTLGLSLLTGAAGQAPWGYLASKNVPVVESHSVPGSGPYTVTVSQAAAFGGDQSVTSASPVAYALVGSTPATHQYSITPGANSSATYSFNAGDVGANICITYLGADGQKTLNTSIPASGTIVIQAWYGGNGSSTSPQQPYALVASSPAAQQYSIAVVGTTATYSFNAANIGANVLIAYQGVSGTRTQSAVVPPGQTIAITLWFGGGSVSGSVVGSVIQTSVLFTPVTGTPAANQYSVSNGVYTFNAAQASASIVISYFTLSGSNYALGYSGIAYVAAAAYPLGDSPQLPNFNFEVEGVLSNQEQQEVIGEQYAIPGGDYIQPVRYNGATFISDQGVTDQAGNVYTRVFTTPGPGEYFVNVTTDPGYYQFNPQNVGTIVNIDYAASAGPDANPAGVAYDLLTDARYGVGFPTARMADMTTYQAYCGATGLLISPAYTSQTQSSSMIDDIAQATNSAAVWSDGALKFVPYGDQDITANGYSYTAPSAPLYSLTDDDFLPNQNATGSNSSSNTDPVLFTRKRASDQLNSIKLEWLDRANSYNPAIIEAKDQATINIFGLRQDASRAFHMFCNGNAARISVQLQLQREAIRNIYQITLDQRYVVLDPMDIIAISDSYLGLDEQWVRILEITENDDMSLSITAEEYLDGTGNAPLYNHQKNTGFQANYNADPGNVNTPVIFEPPVQITSAADLEVWIGVSGGPLWGGCDVLVSTDGNTYKKAGRITGAARQGVLSASLASAADPDTMNTLSVDLSQSFGQLLSGTQSDADNYHTLCYVDGELISFETAQLTASFNYNLTYLRRGAYGSAIGAHAAGSQVLRLDAGVFPYSYDKSKIGQTFYIKLLSFNMYGGALQSESEVEPYLHVVTGPPLPGQVQGFTAQQQGNVVAFAWVDLPNDVGLKGYDIAYGIPGSAWAAKTFLTESHRGTEMTNANVPPGTWEFSIRGHDIADNLGPETLAQLVVTNPNTLVYQGTQAPFLQFYGAQDSTNHSLLGRNWLENFSVHYTGVLVPTGFWNASTYAPVGAPSVPTLSQSPGGSLTLGTLYVKITQIDNTGESTPSGEVSLAVLPGNLLTVTPELTGFFTFSADYGAVSYNVYVGSSAGAETLQNVAPVLVGSNWTMPASGLVSGVSPPTSDRTGWQVFDMFLADPVLDVCRLNVSSGANDYAVDTGYDADLRLYAVLTSKPGPGQSGTPDIEFWASPTTTAEGAAADLFTFTGYEQWTIGYATMRYLGAGLIYNVVQGSISYITAFTPTLDNPADVENFIATIAPGGSTVTFPTQFHLPPSVIPTVVGATGLYAEASSTTDMDCLINVFDHTDTSVGGTVSIQATGG